MNIKFVRIVYHLTSPMITIPNNTCREFQEICEPHNRHPVVYRGDNNFPGVGAQYLNEFSAVNCYHPKNYMYCSLRTIRQANIL